MTDTVATSAPFTGIVLVRPGATCEAAARRLLSWYDAATPMAPRPAAGGGVELYNPEAKFTAWRLVSAESEWSVSELSEFAATHCTVIVTPDGEWHERGVQTTVDAWREEAQELLADHDHFAALTCSFR